MLIKIKEGFDMSLNNKQKSPCQMVTT